MRRFWSKREIEIGIEAHKLTSVPLDRLAYTDAFEPIHVFICERLNKDWERVDSWLLLLHIRKKGYGRAA